MEFQIIDNVEGLYDLSEQWLDLSREACSPYQLFQDWFWITRWWEHLADQKQYQLHILIGGKNGEIHIIWPWVIRKSPIMNVLEPPGGLMSCFDDALIRDQSSSSQWLDEAWRYLQNSAKFDAIEFRSVHESAQIKSLVDRVGQQPVSLTSAPEINLCSYSDYDDYLSSRSRKMRQNQRRSIKYLGREGDLLLYGEDTEISIEEAIEAALDFKKAWLTARNLSGKTLETDAGEAFLKTVARDYSDPGSPIKAVVSTAYLDGKLIAVGLGFRYGNHHFEYLGAFDYEWERHGPGRAQMEYAIRD
ncbi:MAG: GNAT family N-acetyltransferase [Thiotrichales bacterium]